MRGSSFGARRSRVVALVLTSAACVATAAARPPGPAKEAPSPERVEAERTYRDVYGSEDDKATQSKSGAVKVRFAQELAEAKDLAASDPTLAVLLKEKIVAFASADPSGYPLALETLVDLLDHEGAKRAPLLEQIAALRDKLLREEKGEARVAPAEKLVLTYRELAGERQSAGELDKASEALEKARSVARVDLKKTPEILNELAEDVAQLARRRRSVAAMAAARKAIAAKADDPQAHATLGIYELPLEGMSQSAGNHLLKAGKPALKALGEVLAKGGTDDLELADLMRAASEVVTGDERATLRAQATRHYQKLIEANPDGPQSVRIKLILTQMEKSASPGQGSTRLLNNKMRARIVAAIENNQLAETEIRGGGGPINREIPRRGAVLIGFEMTLGQFFDVEPIKSLRPIFLTSAGEVRGQIYGIPSNKPAILRAKPGYAITGLTIKAGLNLDGIRATFMKIDGDRLNPREMYQGAWVSGTKGDEQPIDAKGMPVVGVIVRPNDGSVGIGLIHIKP